MVTPGRTTTPRPSQTVSSEGHGLHDGALPFLDLVEVRIGDEAHLSDAAAAADGDPPPGMDDGQAVDVGRRSDADLGPGVGGDRDAAVLRPEDDVVPDRHAPVVLQVGQPVNRPASLPVLDALERHGSAQGARQKMLGHPSGKGRLLIHSPTLTWPNPCRASAAGAASKRSRRAIGLPERLSRGGLPGASDVFRGRRRAGRDVGRRAAPPGSRDRGTARGRMCRARLRRSSTRSRRVARPASPPRRAPARRDRASPCPASPGRPVRRPRGPGRRGGAAGPRERSARARPSGR